MRGGERAYHCEEAIATEALPSTLREIACPYKSMPIAIDDKTASHGYPLG